MMPDQGDSMPRCSFFLGALAACLACVGVTVSAQESNPVQHPPQADGAEARLLVKFREGAAGRAQGQAANTVQSVAGVDKVQALAARTQIKFRGSRAVGGAWHAVELDPTMSLPEQLVRIRSDESVEAATISTRRAGRSAVRRAVVSAGERVDAGSD
jgi:hypothetical protein